MVQVAESMTGAPLAVQSQPDPEHLTTLAEAEQLAGFRSKQPTQLPEGMAFTYAQVKQDGSTTQVTFHYSDGNQVISMRQVKDISETLESPLQRPLGSLSACHHPWPAGAAQPGFLHRSRLERSPEWRDGAASVTWFEDGILYSVSGFNAYQTQVWLEIAESVKLILVFMKNQSANNEKMGLPEISQAAPFPSYSSY
jgi:hypothetical protein